jgi:hypothetical protein
MVNDYLSVWLVSSNVGAEIVARSLRRCNIQVSVFISAVDLPSARSVIEAAAAALRCIADRLTYCDRVGRLRRCSTARRESNGGQWQQRRDRRST